MQSDAIVVRLPSVDGRFGVFDAGKPIQIETIRCELAVADLYTCVLSRLAVRRALPTAQPLVRGTYRRLSSPCMRFSCIRWPLPDTFHPMFMRASNCRCLLFALVGFLLTVGLWCQPGNAAEEFYAVFGLEHSFSSVDYEKSVSLNSPISLMTASDNERDSVNALKVALGYHLPLSERVYLAGEIEGALYLNEDVKGFLKGTGEGDTDVWPGPWTLERRRAIGLNARLGYVPGSLDFMGPERSLYLSRAPAGSMRKLMRGTSTDA